MVGQRAGYRLKQGMSQPFSASTTVAGQISRADLEHASLYLSPELVEALQLHAAAPSLVLQAECLSHLDYVLGGMRRYLPDFLIEEVLRDPTPGRAGGKFLEGTLLFADVSGFTAMSERLSRIGREGAEEIASIINLYFTVMLTLLRDQGGQLLTFGGDALLGLFLDQPEDGGLGVASAAQAALHMQAAMAEFTQTQTSQGVFPLRMKISLHHGRFFAAQLGDALAMEHGLFGADVNATAAGESLATAGQVLLDQATLAALPVPYVATPVEARYACLEHVGVSLAVRPSRLLIPDDPAAPWLSRLKLKARQLDGLAPYLSPALLARLTSDVQGLRLEGEHRVVATLFANVRGLGDIADALGPGQEAAITGYLNRYLTAMANVIRRFDGEINKIDLYDHGDKLLAFFGAPTAHEDDAERAVRAALEMQAALQDQCAALTGPWPPLTQHIGISYGYVFAGDVGAVSQHEYTVMGDNVNLAARLMTTAADGEVVIGELTRRKVKALFDLEAKGEVQLKGKSAPVSIFRVRSARPIPETVRGLEGIRAPLVGRDPELRLLQGALAKVAAGQGQIVCVTGEAGLGKSRLVNELRERLEPRRWLRGRCLSYTESVSYYPFLALVRQVLDLQPDSELVETEAKLRTRCLHAAAPADLRDAFPYLAHFLSLTLDAGQEAKIRYLDAEALQKRTFLALRVLIEDYASPRWGQGPLALVLDDVHWIDQASLALLKYLFPLIRHLPVLFLLLYRVEADNASETLRAQSVRDFPEALVNVELKGLSPADSRRLLANLVPLDPWPGELETMILNRADGNPLYIEELLRTLMETGVLTRTGAGAWQAAPHLEAVTVPDTLQGLLMTRLDRLDESPRHTVQVASVIGHRIPLDVLLHATAEEGARLNDSLTDLQQHDILREAQRHPDLAYAFRHPLMQSVSYESLLARVRRAYHEVISAYLETQLVPGREAELYSLIAYHAFAGQVWERALRYLVLAGQHAQAQFANQEAIDHFDKALQAAGHLPPEKTELSRLTIHLALGELLTTTSQFDPALDHLQQALALAGAQAARDAEVSACRWLARLNELRGEYAQAFEWIERGLAALQGRETAEAVQLRITAGLIRTRQGQYDAALEAVAAALRLAEHLGDLTALARAANMLGLIAYNRSDSRTAATHYERGLALYEQAGDLHGQAISHNLLANASLSAGQWSLADQHYRRARDIFNQMGDIYNSAFADNNLGGIALNQGRLDEAQAFYAAALQALERIGASVYVLGVVEMNLGAMLSRRGDAASAEAGRQRLRASRELFEQAGTRDFLPELHRHLAEVELGLQHLAAAEAHGQTAWQLAQELAMRDEAGCALRVLGEVAAAQGQWPLAEHRLADSTALLEDVSNAYELARTQLARARLQQALGKPAAARELLAACQAVFERLEAALDLAAARQLQQTLP